MMKPYLVNAVQYAGGIDRQNQPVVLMDKICSDETLGRTEDLPGRRLYQRYRQNQLLKILFIRLQVKPEPHWSPMATGDMPIIFISHLLQVIFRLIIPVIPV